MRAVERRFLIRAIWLIVLAIPFATLAVEWIEKGAFAALISPHIHRLELVEWIPKLSRDLDEIAYRHYHYPPDPYLYWYAATLLIATAVALCLIPAVLREMTKDGWRFQPRQRRFEELVNSRSKQLWLAFGLLMFLLWPWVGLSALGDYRRSMPPGSFHDIFMAFLLAFYAGAVAVSPAMVKFLILRRRHSM